MEIRGRVRDVRVLRMRIGKERIRDVKVEADARALIDNAAIDATLVANQLFEFGYFTDVWAGHEELLPAAAGVVAFVPV